MQYSYECIDCGIILQRDTVHTVRIGEIHEKPCPVCRGRVKRAAAFSYKPPMREHFNTALWRPIRNEAHFTSELHREADRLSERSGVDHSYVQVDYREKEALGVTDEGLDETARARHDAEHQA